MYLLRTVSLAVAALPFIGGPAGPAYAADREPHIRGIFKPQAGEMQIIFHGGNGPFRVESRSSLDPSAPWASLPGAYVTQLQPGVFMGFIPMGPEGLGFYRLASEYDGITELNGWTVLAKVSAPSNGVYFVQGESPVVSVTILDNFAQGLSRSDFSTLNLYLYGPQDPLKTVTAVKLLNASTNRAARPHHYIDLKSNPDVQINNNVLTYRLRPVTDEAPGTYRMSVWTVLASNAVEQIMKFADFQIGTSQVESPVVANRAADGTAKCASCHQGPISGKTYMAHIDPGYSPVGNWSLDYEPTKTCKSCHNNDGYAATRDTNGIYTADAIVRRVHGIHMGEGLENYRNTNELNGVFKEYREVVFPADVRNCTTCHLDNRWKTKPSRLACGTCHDNVWFGPEEQGPLDMEVHQGGPQLTDNNCTICHPSDTGYLHPVASSHRIPPPAMDQIDVTMTRPANGLYYVAGERPVVTLVIKDSSGTNVIDHTKVTDGNFSTAALFVYGPRDRSVPVLTSFARNVNSRLRASVTSSKPGPWAINGKVFKIAVNGSAPQEITIVGASNLVTAAEVVASLNAVITNLNGGAKATISGANVNMKTLIQGANARFEIYNGDVTTAMGWKRAPNTVMEPDVTVAAASTFANDLRALSDPLDYSDPMVTRTTTNITYQLDDVAGLVAGTYNVYAYYLPKAGKIAGLTNLTGIGHFMFQIGTATLEKKIATNCKDCHGDTIWHLAEGPIHAEPFDTDYCNACHDYSHNGTGDMFKNQGGTSLNGWSGYGAMPISRRVHGIHYAHYLEHSEEIYANATKETFGGIIFPQDVRNCTKCHAESNTWKQNPSRMACLACHDTDEAKAHGTIMTYIPDPKDPYGPGSVETCEICHGEDAEFSADKVHSISKPYVPPYPRAPKEP